MRTLPFLVAAAFLLPVSALSAQAAGTVILQQKISATQGNFAGGALLGDFELFGTAQAGLGDLDGDGVGDLAVSAYHDDGGCGCGCLDGGPCNCGGTSGCGDPTGTLTQSGAVYILFLNPGGTVKSYSKINAALGSMPYTITTADHFGSSVASIGDLDGDGNTDIAIGAWHDSELGVRHGAVYITFLNSDGTVKTAQKINDAHGGLTTPLVASDHLGTSVCAIGDVDGDGVMDIASGAVGDHVGGMPGRVIVMFLNPDGTVHHDQAISTTAGNFTGTVPNGSGFGRGVAALGDQDGDGILDLAVGAAGGGMVLVDYINEGSVWMLHLLQDGTVKSWTKINHLQGGVTGIEPEDRFGNSMIGLGDLDADGVPDLAVGAPRDDDGGSGQGANYGAVWILHPKADGNIKSYEKISKTSGTFTGTIKAGDEFGSNLTLVPDHDGNGVTDLGVSAWLDDDAGFLPPSYTGGSGAVWVVYLDGPKTAPWKDLGGALAGVSGYPSLVGNGTLQAGDPVTVTLTNAKANSTAILVIGLSQIGLPLFGGTIVPAPDFLMFGIPTGEHGIVPSTATWPAGVPPISLYMQYWIADDAAPKDFSASNGLVGEVP